MHGHGEGASEWESEPSSKQDLKTVPPILRLGFSAFTRGCQSLLSLRITEPSRTPLVGPETKSWTTTLLAPWPTTANESPGPVTQDPIPRTPTVRGDWG